MAHKAKEIIIDALNIIWHTLKMILEAIFHIILKH